jgi:hypothetical protein
MKNQLARHLKNYVYTQKFAELTGYGISLLMERQSQGTILVVSAGLLVVRAAFPWFKLSGNGVFFISICEHFCID